mmetsp:Transcript_39122/g.116880  ORF Transcript_39122/g.116880 Transcript_39122/m.116880 type:complete len:201 (-) Transcript_39122:194-796(-)
MLHLGGSPCHGPAAAVPVAEPALDAVLAGYGTGRCAGRGGPRVRPAAPGTERAAAAEEVTADRGQAPAHDAAGVLGAFAAALSAGTSTPSAGCDGARAEAVLAPSAAGASRLATTATALAARAPPGAAGCEGARAGDLLLLATPGTPDSNHCGLAVLAAQAAEGRDALDALVSAAPRAARTGCCALGVLTGRLCAVRHRF